jgi:hypothetical protein
MCPASNEQEAMPESLRDVGIAQGEQQRADIISALRAEPISTTLQAYYTELKKRSTRWDRGTFIEGIEHFANIWGAERPKYFRNDLNRLQSINSLRKN